MARSTGTCARARQCAGARACSWQPSRLCGRLGSAKTRGRAQETAEGGAPTGMEPPWHNPRRRQGSGQSGYESVLSMWAWATQLRGQWTSDTIYTILIDIQPSQCLQVAPSKRASI
eukprot:6209538-Pleurochrysis_carterae.AAC.1